MNAALKSSVLALLKLGGNEYGLVSGSGAERRFRSYSHGSDSVVLQCEQMLRNDNLPQELSLTNES